MAEIKLDGSTFKSPVEGLEGVVKTLWSGGRPTVDGKAVHWCYEVDGKAVHVGDTVAQAEVVVQSLGHDPRPHVQRKVRIWVVTTQDPATSRGQVVARALRAETGAGTDKVRFQVLAREGLWALVEATYHYVA